MPTLSLLPQIVDRLSKYQHPIQLTLHNPKQLTHSEVIENISILTQLTVFKQYDKQVPVPVQPKDYFKLSKLTNLEILYFNNLVIPHTLLKHLPKLKRVSLLEPYKEIEHLQIIADHCPHFEALTVADASLSHVPISVTKLTLNDKQSNELTRLTKLKRLVIYMPQKDSIDLHQITWLQSMRVAAATDITGLEFSRHLTKLHVHTWGPEMFNVSRLVDSVTSLPQLWDIKLVMESEAHLSGLSQLTSLLMRCSSADQTCFPTTLQKLHLSTHNQFDLSHISHFVHLTHLRVDDSFTTTLEPFKSLTRLMHLEVNAKKQISFSTLQHLTSLVVREGRLDPHSVKRLTNLRNLEAVNAAVYEEAWENIQYLTDLTSLRVENPGNDFTEAYDYTTIAKLPLESLEIPHLENIWAFLSTLTTLKDLSAYYVENEENILSLTALSKLTRLEMKYAEHEVTLIHLSKLTTLQEIERGLFIADLD